MVFNRNLQGSIFSGYVSFRKGIAHLPVWTDTCNPTAGYNTFRCNFSIDIRYILRLRAVFPFFRRKLLHVFLWMGTIVGRKDTASGRKYPANGRKWPKSLLERHCIKNQPRAEKNASGKKNTFGQLFCLKPFGLKLKPSRRSRCN